MVEIKAVSHPIPIEYAERIYNDGKTVFVGKSYLSKVSEGDKFVIYESHGAKAYTGWADIKSVGKIRIKTIISKFGKNLMISAEELKKYSKEKSELNYIDFENFEKFKNPVKPSRFVVMRGKYIYEDEFKTIDRDK